MNSSPYISNKFSVLFPPTDESSRIVISCADRNYSASAIARAVEDSDTTLLNLNLLGSDPESFGRLLVDLRVNRRIPDAVCRSLERYGFDVVATKASRLATGTSDTPADEDNDADDYTQTMQTRANYLLRCLDL